LNDPTWGYQENLQKRAEHLAKIQNHFWKRWSQEYLSALREQDRISGKGALENRISVGDVVLVEDDLRPRAKWRLALVEKLNVGNDGLVRSAHIKTSTGSTSRPITKLYPLEVSKGEISELKLRVVKASKDTTLNKDTAPAPRPQRNAALLAKQKIKVCANELNK
jgi:hypothetical protein